MTGNICWNHNYKKHKQLLLSSEHSIVSGNPLLNELNLSEKQAKWFSLFLPFKRCYACTSTKITNFYPTNCLSNEKHSNGDKTMDYLANYPCSIESVSQIEKQLWHKLRNILSLNPVSVRILQFLKTRSRISKPTFITLMLLIYKQRLL